MAKLELEPKPLRFAWQLDRITGYGHAGRNNIRGALLFIIRTPHVKRNLAMVAAIRFPGGGMRDRVTGENAWH